MDLGFSKMSKTTAEGAKRLLKCFCGCSELTEQEVKRIHRLNCGTVLNDRQSLMLLRKFLEQRRDGDKSLCEQYMDVYELSASYIQQPDFVPSLDELEELSELGLQYHLEKELRNEIKTGVRMNIARCLNRIQGECRNEIEASQEYKDFKQALLDKLKQ